MTTTGGKSRLQRPISFVDEIVSIGNVKTSAVGAHSIALGAFADAETDDSIAIGYYAYSGSTESVAIGSHTNATQDHTTAIGSNVNAAGYQTVGLGTSLGLGGTRSVGVGSILDDHGGAFNFRVGSGQVALQGVDHLISFGGLSSLAINSSGYEVAANGILIGQGVATQGVNRHLLLSLNNAEMETPVLTVLRIKVNQALSNTTPLNSSSSLEVTSPIDMGTFNPTVVQDYHGDTYLTCDGSPITVVITIASDSGTPLIGPDMTAGDITISLYYNDGSYTDYPISLDMLRSQPGTSNTATFNLGNELSSDQVLVCGLTIGANNSDMIVASTGPYHQHIGDDSSNCIFITTSSFNTIGYSSGGCVFIGYNGTIMDNSPNTVVIGYRNNVGGNCPFNIAIGSGNYVNAYTDSNSDSNCVVVGNNSGVGAQSGYSSAFGTNCVVGIASDESLVAGYSSQLGHFAAGSVLLGTRTSVGQGANQSIVIGNRNDVGVNTQHGIGIGYYAVLGDNCQESIVIGSNSTIGNPGGAGADHNIIVGSSSTINDGEVYNVAVGLNNTIKGSYNLRFGVGQVAIPAVDHLASLGWLSSLGINSSGSEAMANGILIGQGVATQGVNRHLLLSLNDAAMATPTLIAVRVKITQALSNSTPLNVSSTLNVSSPVAVGPFDPTAVQDKRTTTSQTCDGSSVIVTITLTSDSGTPLIGPDMTGGDVIVSLYYNDGSYADYPITLAMLQAQPGTSNTATFNLGNELSSDQVLVCGLTIGANNHDMIVLSTGTGSQSIGADSDSCIFIGISSSIANTSSSTVIIGNNAHVGDHCDHSICLGNNTIGTVGGVGCSRNVAIGNSIVIEDVTVGSIAIGYGVNIKAHSLDSMAIGLDAAVGQSSANSITIGLLASIGDSSRASVAIGSGATVGNNSSECIVIGASPRATNYVTNSIVLGGDSSIIDGSVSSPTNHSIAIGYRTEIGPAASGSIAIGSKATDASTAGAKIFLGSELSIAIGASSQVGAYPGSGAPSSIIIGANAVVTGTKSIGIGMDANVSHDYSQVYGDHAASSKSNEVVYGCLTTPANSFHVVSTDLAGTGALDLVNFDKSAASSNYDSAMYLYFKDHTGAIVSKHVTVNSTTGALTVVP